MKQHLSYEVYLKSHPAVSLTPETQTDNNRKIADSKFRYKQVFCIVSIRDH